MVTRKDRRQNGRVTPIIKLNIKREELVEQGLEPEEYWDDWEDYRVGFRINRDKSQLRSRFINFAKNLEVERYNKKIRKMSKRRLLKKRSRNIDYNMS